MVLHIGIDCNNLTLKQQLIQRLTEFYEKKSYKIGIIDLTDISSLNDLENEYNLKYHEKLLLSAFSKSIHYNDENWDKYDLCFWNGTVLSDYKYTMAYIPENYIKQLNRFLPELDLYITITPEDDAEIMSLSNINHKTIRYNKETVFTDLVKTIFDNLPRCNWCGKLFTKSQKNKKYCSSKCKKYSLEEQYRKNNRNYYHRYKNVMSERSKGQLGSKGANLHGTADSNPVRELQKVRNAKKALGLRPIQ